MKPKLTFLLSLTFLFLFNGSVYGDDLQEGLDAYKRKDYKTARRLWVALAEQGDVEARLLLDIINPQSSKYRFEWSRLSAKQGNAEAQLLLGLIYHNGLGVLQDNKEAAKWYRLAAEQGKSEAKKQLNILIKQNDSNKTSESQLLQQGLKAVKNKKYHKALEIIKPLAEKLKLSVENRNADVQLLLGILYNHGGGIPQDYKEAVKWYRLAAEQGNALAQSNLGLMYGKGQGVPQDYKEAVKWFRLSAEQGNALAQSNLGLMYTEGQRVLQDYALAHMWFNLCGSSGDKDCIKNRNIIEKKMSKSQIEEAQRMARNWKPTKK
jgi:uncharacterized protein